MTCKVETPAERTTKRMTPTEAREFMTTWCRLVAPDGSTVAYVPDEATAKRMAQLVDLYRMIARRDGDPDWQHPPDCYCETCGGVLWYDEDQPG